MKYFSIISIAFMLTLAVHATQLSYGGEIVEPVCVEPPSDLVSWWPLDENSGETTASDSVGDNTGSYVSSPTQIAGLVDGALSFVGGAKYVEVPDDISLQPQELTIDAWVRGSDNPGGNRYIVAKGAQACDSPSYALYSAGASVKFLLREDGGTWTAITGPNIWDGEWHHVAGTYDGSFMTLYVDGTQVAQTPYTKVIDYTLSSHDDLLFGTYKNTCTLPFFGDVDEIELFSRALDSTEIEAIYDAGSAGKCKVSPSIFLVIDEDSIDNGIEPNDFSGDDVNEDGAEVGVRDQLPFFATAAGLSDPDNKITLHTGEVGDEGWFALKTIPDSWEGLDNFILAAPPIEDSEDLLDKIPDVTPLRFTGLKLLEGERVCAVVYDSDISINYDPLNGSLKGANLGTVAFEVNSVTVVAGTDDFSDSSLPAVDITILDAEEVCEGPLVLFTDAPEPESSSEPEDTGANHLTITKAEAQGDDELDIVIETFADIPTDGSAGAFGYGIITDGVTFNNVLALTTHAGVLDHSDQDGDDTDPIFHSHILDLGATSVDCAGFDLEVDLLESVSSGNNIDAMYDLKVDDNKLEIKSVPTSDLADGSVDAIVAFTITGAGPDVLPGIPHLCLDIVGTGTGL